MEKVEEFTIKVYSENHIGLLNRLTILFTRRKVNIESLTTSEYHIPGVHSFTIVINSTEDMVRKITQQAEKLVDVLKAFYYRTDDIHYQEIALYKVPTSALTAIGNDSHFRYVFARQIEALGNPEDHLIAITTSGNSENVLEGLKQAKAMGIRTLVLTGGDGGRALDLADAAIRVSLTDRTPRIQETLLLVEHLLCEWVEGALFPPWNDSNPEAAGKDKR